MCSCNKPKSDLNLLSTPLVKKPPRTSFMFKVLVALKVLQDANENCPVSLQELQRYMEKTNALTCGDTTSQLEHILNVAVDARFVKKSDDEFYSSLVAAANLRCVPLECLDEEIQRVEDIFTTYAPDGAKLYGSQCQCGDLIDNCQKSPMIKAVKKKRRRRSASVKRKRQKTASVDCEPCTPKRRSLRTKRTESSCCSDYILDNNNNNISNDICAKTETETKPKKVKFRKAVKVKYFLKN